MKPTARQFTALALLVTVAGFVGGIVSSRIFAEPVARAEERSTQTTVYVGPQGLAFRSLDGKTIARLSTDANGGVFEVYNANEQPGARIRASSFTGGVDIVPQSAQTMGRTTAQPAETAPFVGPAAPGVRPRDLGF